MSAPSPDFRFHLPPGPPVPSTGWRRRHRMAIRVGSIVAAVLLVAAAVTAITFGFGERSHFTASGAVTVDCGTKAAMGSIPARFGDQVRIYDADDPTGSPLATSRLDELRVVGGGACLARFEVAELETVEAYVVLIGDGYRRIVTPAALSAGYLFE